MKVHDRRKNVENSFEKRGRKTMFSFVEELSKIHNVSRATIWNDIKVLRCGKKSQKVFSDL